MGTPIANSLFLFGNGSAPVASQFPISYKLVTPTTANSVVARVAPSLARVSDGGRFQIEGGSDPLRGVRSKKDGAKNLCSNS